MHCTADQRLALRRQQNTDETLIIAPLLGIMQEHKLDFHLTFRQLSFFRPSLLRPPPVENGTTGFNNSLEKFISILLNQSPEPESMDHAKATNDWMAWLEKYSERITSEESEWPGDVDAQREKTAKAANPRFVLRQWLLEEVIAKVENDPNTGKRILAKVLQVPIVTLFLFKCSRLTHFRT